MPMDPKEIKRLAKKRYDEMMAARADEPEAEDNPAEEAKEAPKGHHGVSVTIAVGVPHPAHKK